MVYYPRVSFKTGIFPSAVRSFPTNGNYSATQRLMLTSTRIFGTKIGYVNYDSEALCVQEFHLSGSQG